MSQYNTIDNLMKQAGLTSLTELDPSIVVDVKYATPDNFTGKILYAESFGVFLQKDLAEAVVKANHRLQKLYPSRRIVIFDAARPVSVQKKMYDLVKGTDQEPYIANPYGEFPGGFHNYGLAVDLSIIDLDKGLLDMGTDYDSFSPLAHVGNEREMVIEGKISIDAYSNRMVLYSLMGEVGLLPHPNEWWHYQSDYREDSKGGFLLLDF